LKYCITSVHSKDTVEAVGCGAGNLFLFCTNAGITHHPNRLLHDLLVMLAGHAHWYQVNVHLLCCHLIGSNLEAPTSFSAFRSVHLIETNAAPSTHCLYL
jgi:hypothetical protein